MRDVLAIWPLLRSKTRALRCDLSPPQARRPRVRRSVRHGVRLGVRVRHLHRVAVALGDVTNLENAMKHNLTEDEILADPVYLMEALRKQLTVTNSRVGLQVYPFKPCTVACQKRIWKRAMAHKRASVKTRLAIIKSLESME